MQAAAANLLSTRLWCCLVLICLAEVARMLYYVATSRMHSIASCMHLLLCGRNALLRSLMYALHEQH
jgi:hypothetical protein